MVSNKSCRAVGAVLVVSLAVLATKSEALAGDRCPPSGGVGTWTWDGGGDGTLWSDANNWNPNSVPPSGADVIINDAAGPVVMMYPTVTVETLACDGVLTMAWADANSTPSLIILDCATIHTLEMNASGPHGAFISGPDFAAAGQLTITNHLQGTKARFGNSVSGIEVRIAQGATATLMGIITISGATVFEVDGVVTLDGANCNLDWGAAFRVDNDGQTSCGSIAAPPGLLIMKNNSTVAGNASHPLVINGCLKTDGTGNAGLTYNPIQINGSLQVSGGTEFRIGGGGTASGSISVGVKAMLDIARIPGGATRFFTADASSSISCAPDGTIRHYTGSGGTDLTVNGSVDVQGTWKQAPPDASSGGAGAFFNGSLKGFANYEFGGSYLGGNAQIVVSNSMQWSEGQIEAFVEIQPGAVIDMMSSGVKSLNTLMQIGGTAKVSNNTAIRLWFGGGFGGPGTLKIEPGGVLEMNSGSVLEGSAPGLGGTVHNNGTITTGPGHTSSSITTVFTNGGTLTVDEGTLKFGGSFYQVSGATVLIGGALESVSYHHPTFVFDGGSLTGPADILGNVFVNNGTDVLIAGGSRTLSITGNYTQTSTANVRFLIDGNQPGDGYDQLLVSGTATLDGFLYVSTSTSFRPILGHAFRIIDANAVSGTFDAMLGNLDDMNIWYAGDVWLTSTTPPGFVPEYIPIGSGDSSKAWDCKVSEETSLVGGVIRRTIAGETRISGVWHPTMWEQVDDGPWGTVPLPDLTFGGRAEVVYSGDTGDAAAGVVVDPTDVPLPAVWRRPTPRDPFELTILPMLAGGGGEGEATDSLAYLGCLVITGWSSDREGIHRPVTWTLMGANPWMIAPLADQGYGGVANKGQFEYSPNSICLVGSTVDENGLVKPTMWMGQPGGPYNPAFLPLVPTYNQGSLEDMWETDGVYTAVGWVENTLGVRRAAQWRSTNYGPWTVQLMPEPPGFTSGAADSVARSDETETTRTVGVIEGAGPTVDVALWTEDSTGTITPLQFSSLTSDPPVEIIGRPSIALEPDGSMMIVTSGTVSVGGFVGEEPGAIVYKMLPPPPPCIGNINDDQSVNIVDLLQVISNWSAPGLNPADVNLDLTVNITDLLLVISKWGPCP